MRIRPMKTTDLVAAERLTARAFTWSADDHTWSARPPAQARRWIERIGHLLTVDPGGCWVADDDAGRTTGVAVSARRDLMWILSTFAVDPAGQNRGMGQALLDAAVGYGAGCLRGMICALPHPGAVRRYRRAGFTLHPTMRLSGTVDRSALPVVDGVRPGTAADLDLVDSIDRQVRGATHRGDHAALGRDGQLLVCDLFTGSGYAYAGADSVTVLAATNRTVAQRLLWSALAAMPAAVPVTVRYLTSDQEWAVDVGLAAGLGIYQDGYLALRHMRPPSPYVPSVPFG